MRGMMKVWVSMATLFVVSVAASAQTARNYYDELYKAGGLDRMADEYVCFDEDSNSHNFFIFGRSETYKQFLISIGGYAKLSPATKASLTRGWINVRGYVKGIPFSHEEMYDKDGDSWLTETGLAGGTPVRLRLSISFETLRYKRTVEVMGPHSIKKYETSTFGRCEQVPDSVRRRQTDS